MATNEALIRAYESQSALLRERVVAYSLSVWAAARSFRDADVDRIVAQIVPAVQAGQLQLATLTDAYIGQVAKRAGVVWVPSLDRTVTAYRGVDAGIVYRRPAVALYTALAAGEGFSRAVDVGQSRLLSIVSTDLQQARNRQASQSVRGSGFSSYRRVLTGKEDCDLCQLASTNVYSKADLMPIHPGCDCGVEPVVEFDAKPDPAAETVVVNMHGELGPTLGWAGEHFTGPSDL